LIPLVLGLWFLLAALALAQEPTPSATEEQRPVVTPEPTQELPVYVVRPGDTLYDIAQRFGSTIEAIVAANDIADPRLINVGQRLIIPTDQPELVPVQEPVADRRVHPVRPGEILPSLAFRYSTTVWAFREVNELGYLGLLVPGQVLTIPPPAIVITGTPTFPVVTARPVSVVQGQTMLVEVESEDELDLSGRFLGQDLSFALGEGGYWALTGVDVLTPGGFYPLVLTITETQTGDLLTMSEEFTVTEGSFTAYNVVVPADRQNLLDPAIAEAERRKVNAAVAGVTEEQYWADVFGYPLAGDLRITAPFGQRRSYSGGPVSSYHSGQDLGADEGVPVYAPAVGRVVLAEPLQVRGQVVILDHGWGVYTGFWHLSQIDVTEGQMVERGQVVGLVGDTGLSTGPHLHWEMRVRGVPVDPFQWTQQTFP
jgi:murein DD-endopeptidase MepM/ murein hydrolase activator NlpD